MKNCFLITWILLFILLSPLKGQDINFFNYWSYYSDAENSLYKYHCDRIFYSLDMRENKINKLESKDEWLKWQAMVRKKLSETIRNFPENQPLNPRITGVLKEDGYRIEKVIYESIPGYYVTGALYIPDGQTGRAPAIFYACGHSEEGFRVAIYQHIIINLVKKGFVVFTIDPMGQGERYEYWDRNENKPVFPVPDHQHSYAGAQCFISGYSIASYFIWDVIRGIDYMLTRKEVDPDRIGLTGRSGGGNLTAYVGAIDDRVLAAAPECYITNYKYLCKTIGPQCAEQNLYQMVHNGLDHPDFIIARAPKPTLIISTTRDFFSIQGARESYHEASKIYKALHADNMLNMVEDDTVHASTGKNREAMYAFFQKNLNNPGSSKDVEVKIPDPEELRVTSTGQVQTAMDAETVFSLNKTITEKEISKLNESRKDPDKHFKELLSNVARTSGYPLWSIKANYSEGEITGILRDSVKLVFSGRYTYPGYTMEKYLVPGTGNYMLPVIIMEPTGYKQNKIFLFLDTEGMAHAIKQKKIYMPLLNEGYSLLFSDLPGIGSLGPGYMKGDSYMEGTSYNQWFAAVLAGESHVGLRTHDLVKIYQCIKNNLPAYGEFSAMATGPVAAELLHASVIEPGISKIFLVSSFLSFENIATTRYYKPEFIPFTVAGALEYYDLPDLMAALCPRKIYIINPEGADGKPVASSEANNILSYPSRIYEQKGFKSNFMILQDLSPGDIYKNLVNWLKD